MRKDTEGLWRSEDSGGHQSYHTVKLVDVTTVYIDILLTYYDDFHCYLLSQGLQLFPNLSNKLQSCAELQGLQQ